MAPATASTPVRPEPGGRRSHVTSSNSTVLGVAVKAAVSPGSWPGRVMFDRVRAALAGPDHVQDGDRLAAGQPPLAVGAERRPGRDHPLHGRQVVGPPGGLGRGQRGDDRSGEGVADEGDLGHPLPLDQAEQLVGVEPPPAEQHHRPAEDEGLDGEEQRGAHLWQQLGFPQRFYYIRAGSPESSRRIRHRYVHFEWSTLGQSRWRSRRRYAFLYQFRRLARRTVRSVARNCAVGGRHRQPSGNCANRNDHGEPELVRKTHFTGADQCPRRSRRLHFHSDWPTAGFDSRFAHGANYRHDSRNFRQHFAIRNTRHSKRRLQFGGRRFSMELAGRNIVHKSG